MKQTLLHAWWLLALRGVIAVLFGILAIAWPAITLVSLAVLFAAFALTGGAVWTFGAVKNRKADERWWLLLLFGMASLAAGFIAALYPGLTAIALVILVGANALVSGVIDIAVAVRLRKSMRGELLLILSGIVSLVFGAYLLMLPTGAGALALAFVIGCYAMLTGALMLALALRVRAWSRLNAARSSPPAGAV
jgi:uncharacterized membrane protein HdeD (DUF308 family)